MNNENTVNLRYARALKLAGQKLIESAENICTDMDGIIESLNTTIKIDESCNTTIYFDKTYLY